MVAQSAECRRLVVVRMNPGDDVLVSLRAAAEERGMPNALILSGVGSLNRYHFHVVNSPLLPTTDVFPRGEGPFDILAITGAIINGRVHAHITFSDAQKAMGGHLEEGCRVLTFALVILADTPGLNLEGWDRSVSM